MLLCYPFPLFFWRRVSHQRETTKTADVVPPWRRSRSVGASMNLVANCFADSGGYETVVKITIVISLHFGRIVVLEVERTCPWKPLRSLTL